MSGARLPVEIDRRVARIVRRRRRARVLPLKALETRPRLEQRAIDREVLVGQQRGLPRLAEHRIKERTRDIAAQQPIAAFGEDRRRPDSLVQPEANEPAKQNAVVDLLHQEALAAHRVERLEQQRAQQLLGRNRWATDFRVHRLKPRRQLAQDLVRHRPDRPQRVIGTHPLLGREVTEQVVGLLVWATHANAPVKDGARMVVRRDRSVDPLSLTFSAAC